MSQSGSIEERRIQKRVIREEGRLPQTEEEAFAQGGATIAEHLGPQLGTDAEFLQKGKFDMRRLTILDLKMQAVLAYFEQRGKKVKYWKHIVDWYMNTCPSLGGVGRRQVIDMQRASTGAPPPPVNAPPGWVERNLTDRAWREKGDE